MKRMEYPGFVYTSGVPAVSFRGRIITIGSSDECDIKVDSSQPGIAAHCMYAKGSTKVDIISKKAKLEVNGSIVKGKKELAHGDRLKISGMELIYLEHSEDRNNETHGKTGFGDITGLVDAVVRLMQNREGDISRDLVVNLCRLLDCDAARFVSKNKETEELETLASFPENAESGRFSTRAIEWAEHQGKTILMNDDSWYGENRSRNSLEVNQVATLLCSPFIRDGEVKGFLYMDRISRENPFTDEERNLCDTLVPLFVQILENASIVSRQKETIKKLQGALQNREESGMLFESDNMEETVKTSRKIAKTESSVLILGETGTGKELMARFIHNNSGRSKGPFRAVNCGAIPENLMESELFGYEKGAFTGAEKRKPGLFESSKGGTVFLDEIGDLSPELQIKLLRVIQESEVVPLGSNESVDVDVRLITATNRDLKKEVETGNFREDLYYRLDVFSIFLPPLRERDGDVLLMAEAFLLQYTRQFGLEPKTLSAEARDAMLSYSWPGNIRELQNRIQKACLLSSQSRLSSDDLQLSGSLKDDSNIEEKTPVTSLKEVRREAEIGLIKRTLKKTGGNVSRAARLMDIDRKWLNTRIKEYGLSLAEYRVKK